MTVVERLTSVQARLIAGSSLVIALVFGLWPDHPRDVDPARAAAIAVAAVAWLFSELAGVRTVSAHDLALYESITEHLPPRVLDHLRDHDFSNSFDYRVLASLHDMAAWKGARYRFGDAKLQVEWAELQRRMRTLSNNIARHTGPVAGAGHFVTVHPTMGDPEDPEPFIQARIDELNVGATDVVGAIDTFEINGRRQLRL